ncbi:sugar ABC transporter ATP-binding protein [Paracoccus beibuensis]|uniref:sugar ABC transporter ATP-binding protein n=1 Tax=Paracoccus beibuensis TaxID=547602 RepID=UPI002240416C|nr:sugar ABC transporter ATP-binding protein [Paracoccus beibuensis]
MITTPEVERDKASAPLLALDRIEKSFGSNQVLADVSLVVRPGEVIGLLGENGAGKSTMMNIVAGALQPSGGAIHYAGAKRNFTSIAEGIQAGVAFVHQELSVIGSLSVAENLFLGSLPRNRLGLVDFARIYAQSRDMLDAIGATWIDPKMLAGTLRAGEQQLVEIARAAARKPRLLILDEPTSSLTPHEVSAFLSYVSRARAEGTAIIFITHRLEEAMTICDRLLVLRNGAIVSDCAPDDTSKAQIIRDMTGKDSLFAYRDRQKHETEVALALSGISDGRLIEDISLTVRRGEIFGLFGLVGAGRTELLETICGARRASSGRMELFGQVHVPASPHQALRAGVALVPEGRKTAGILPQHSVRRNASAASLRNMGGGVFVSAKEEARKTRAELRALSVRMTSDGQAITTLSGGNQQKVMFARALLSGPRLLLLDEPTHGVDVGAKSELYEIIRAAADQGLTVIVASSELPEITALCDRVGVLSKGRLAGLLEREKMNEETLLRLAFSEHEA